MTLAQDISAFNRKRKWALFNKMVRPDPAMKVLDVGYSDAEYSPVDNFIDKFYPYPTQIAALGVVPPCNSGKGTHS